jgi:hypothetical protein
MVVAAAALALLGCASQPVTTSKVEPATIEHLGDTGISRLKLTARAVERLGIGTAEVREEQVMHAGKVSRVKVVPYSAVLYLSGGDTWAYTSSEPRVFVRRPITVDYITGEFAMLSDGPPTGTQVVTVGVAELLGTEFKIGH